MAGEKPHESFWRWWWRAWLRAALRASEDTGRTTRLIALLAAGTASMAVILYVVAGMGSNTVEEVVRLLAHHLKG